MSGDNPYRALPPVDALVARFEGLPRLLLLEAARAALAQARTAISDGDEVEVDSLMEAMVRRLQREAGTRIINATGVLLHTNLGRARWSHRAVERAATAGEEFTDVEIDIDTGERGRRGSYVTALLGALTGAEDALVVNNNAAALLLALAATARGRAVPVSRGELIEIGGSYRLPDVMEVSGASLVEVGTTNRTRAGDYEVALQTHDCGAILKVHPSNYRVEGFSQETPLRDLSRLARSTGIPLIHDIGSGLLDSTTPWLGGPAPEWLLAEPAARQSLDEGADLVMFSGDKLLGGPQAGVIVGRAEVISKLRSDPLARALRVDAVTLSALAATLEQYASGDVTAIPFWGQALLSSAELLPRASSLAEHLRGEVVEGHSTVGGGSAPGMTIPSPLVVLPDEDHIFGCLLQGTDPVLARREDGALVIDLRTVDPLDDEVILSAVSRCR